MRHRNTTLLSNLLVGAAAVVVIFALITNLAGQAEAAIVKPYVIHGYKNGPVGIATSDGEVARLALPAGKWVVSAKAYFSATFFSDLTCHLDVGSSWDYSNVKTPASTAQTMVLTAAATLGSPGSAIVYCVSSQTNATLNWLKITALKAGTLTIIQMQ